MRLALTGQGLPYLIYIIHFVYTMSLAHSMVTAWHKGDAQEINYMSQLNELLIFLCIVQ